MQDEVQIEVQGKRDCM